MKCRLLASAMLLVAAFAPPASAAAPPTRAEAQNLLRRFAFSGSPADVDAVVAAGIPAWVAQQSDWQALDDTGSTLETLPTALVSGSLPDYNIFERAVIQHMVLTPRQLQAKLELHWLDHFAVGLEKVGDPAVMYHYDQTIRANALGNFATLLAAVSKEAAMLEWLDNNYNTGPVANQNFAREIMQLYSTGPTALNDDGSPVIDSKTGLPLGNYGEADIKQIALAMTGYYVYYDNTNNNPQTRYSVVYDTTRHQTGPLTFFNHTWNLPNDSHAIDRIAQVLAGRPSTAPFMVTELLQRFVNEKPNPRYVSDIVAVWRKTAAAPDQIAQVIAAIIAHPLFPGNARTMLKAPVEMVLDSLRALPGKMQAAPNAVPGGSLLWELSGLGQQLFWPATVFSFYRPGNIVATLNTGTVLGRTGVFANITGATPDNQYVDTYIDMPTLRAAIKLPKGFAVAHYLLDALVDGGDSQLERELLTYLGDTPSDARVRGALWLLLNSPNYAVN